MPKAAFHTLGCKLNYSETATLAREFRQRDFEVVPFGDEADVVVINSCSVTTQTEQKCRSLIRRISRSAHRPFVVVTGCYAQLRPEEIARIDGVDLVLGSAEKLSLFEIVDSFEPASRAQVVVSCTENLTEFQPAYSAGERTRAFLKVQDGCDYSCSFCTIPSARGRSRSASTANVVQQAIEIADEGFREIVLSGVNVGLFGNDSGTSLLQLIRELDLVNGIDRFRISSIEPNLLTSEIIEFVAASGRFAPHFHIPLQSGDNTVLAGMRRRYRREVYRNRVAEILSRIPDAAIGADVIVGFPGETDEAFENTVSFIEDLPLAYLHVFTYSERPGTAAIDIIKDGDVSVVPKAERRRRSLALRLLSEKKRRDFYGRFVGTDRPVLWESEDDAGQVTGLTDNYLRVRGSSKDHRSGDLESVSLGSLREDGTIWAGTWAALPVIDSIL